MERGGSERVGERASGAWMGGGLWGRWRWVMDRTESVKGGLS